MYFIIIPFLYMENAVQFNNTIIFILKNYHVSNNPVRMCHISTPHRLPISNM